MSETPPPPDASSALARLEAVARRELGAVELRVLAPGATTVEAPNVLFASLPDGRRVVVTFPDAPDDREAIGRRLEILVRSFAQTIEQQAADPGRVRAPVSSLHDELRALATRAQAGDALVLDAHSPVVWGASSRPRPHAGLTRTPELEEALRQVELSRRQLTTVDSDIGLADADEAVNDDELPPLPEISQRAMREVRALPGVDALRRGGLLHHTVRGVDFGYSVHSFAGIYLLVLVFEEPFDEIRAERAVLESLPRIERLVLALPPLDPTPEPRGNVVSLRRRGRR